MAYTARDGKTFPDMIRLRRYEGYLDSKAAPGGAAQEEAVKAHGLPTKVTVERGPMGRHRITAEHPDGHKSTVVHGSNEAAHSVMADYLGINPPIAQDLHRNANAHPTGPGERDRLRQEDHREND